MDRASYSLDHECFQKLRNSKLDVKIGHDPSIIFFFFLIMKDLINTYTAETVCFRITDRYYYIILEILYLHIKNKHKIEKANAWTDKKMQVLSLVTLKRHCNYKLKNY